MMAVLVTVLVILFWVAGSIAVLALLTARKMRTDKRQLGDGHRRDSQIHRRRAEADAEVEEHDIDQMLDAINERRRRAGRREIGEELADELMRSTWDHRV